MALERKKTWLRFLFLDSVYDVITWAIIGLTIGGIWYFKSAKDSQGVNWSIVILIVSVIAMIAVKTFKHSWADGHARSAETACLDITSIVLKGDKLEAGKVPQIEFLIKNIGKAPAFDVKGSCRVFVSNKTAVQELEKDAPEMIEKADIGNRIGPGDRKASFSQGVKPITAGVLLDLQLGKCNFFVFVNLFYAGGQAAEDVFYYMFDANRKSLILCAK